MRKKSIGVTLIGLLCLSGAGVHAIEFEEIKVDREGKRYIVDSSVVLDACLPSVYRVLTDFDDNALGKISKVFVESRYLEREPSGDGLIYSLAKGCVSFLCKTVERVEVLRVDVGKRIETTALPELSDANHSYARWDLEMIGNRTRMLYYLEYEPNFWVPPVIGTTLVTRSLRKEGINAAHAVESLAAEMTCLPLEKPVAEQKPKAVDAS